MTEETTPAQVTRPSLVERLIAVKRDIGAVGKGDRNAQQGFNFRGIDAVMNAVAGPFMKHGIMTYPTRVVRVDRGTATTSKGSVMNTVSVIVRYAFTDGEEILEFEAAGEAFDSGDKATPKAMSVAYRTALIQALSLPTDEPDPDHDIYDAAAVDQMTDEQVIAEVPKAVDVSALQDLWREQRVTSRPKVVQDAITTRVAYLRAEAGA